MEISTVLNHMESILNMVDELKTMDDTEEQRKSLLSLYDSCNAQIAPVIAEKLPHQINVTLSKNLIVRKSSFGFLVHFPPQSMIECEALQGHMNRQYCWISKSISRLNSDGSLFVRFYQESYFQFFDNEKPSEKTRVNAIDTALIMELANRRADLS